MGIKRLALLIVGASLLLAACGTGAAPDDGGQNQLATVNETVTAANAIISDAVSLYSGFASNSTLERIGTSNCYDAAFDFEIAIFMFPAVNALFFEYDEHWVPVNWRLATGTIACDPDTGITSYLPQPTDALVMSWHTTEGDPVEARVEWQDVTTARTYDHRVDLPSTGFYLGFPTSYASPLGEVVPVPGSAVITLDYRGERLVEVNLEQTLAQTECGPLMEYRTLTASGTTKFGAQQVTLDKLHLDHATDNRLSLEIAGAVTSGSLSIPFAGSAEVTAAAVSRDASTCQLNDVEGPLAGSVDFSVGSAPGLGLEFDWNVELSTGHQIEATAADVTNARLHVGTKYVEIGDITTREDGIFGVNSAPLTFSDRSNLPIIEFVEMLTIPDF